MFLMFYWTFLIVFKSRLILHYVLMLLMVLCEALRITLLLKYAIQINLPCPSSSQQPSTSPPIPHVHQQPSTSTPIPPLSSPQPDLPARAYWTVGTYAVRTTSQIGLTRLITRIRDNARQGVHFHKIMDNAEAWTVKDRWNNSVPKESCQKHQQIQYCPFGSISI